MKQFNTKRNVTSILVVFIGSILFSTSFFAQMRGPMEEPFIPGHLIVQVEENLNIKKIVQNLPAKYDFKINRLLARTMRAWLIEFDPNKLDQMTALNLVRRQKGISIVQNNHIVEIRTAPNDPSYGQQWHHKNTGQTGGTPGADIQSEEAWEITTGGQNANGDDIVVCILEAVDFSHNDLIDNRWENPGEVPGNGIDDDGNGYIDDIHGWDLQSNSGNIPTQGSGHGTNVAGMIGGKGNNDLGVSGINWDVKMMNVTGFDINSEASVVSAYEYPLSLRKLYNQTNGQSGAFVVSTNASWGIDNANPNNYPIWCAFYDTLGLHGILNVGSTSNSNINVDVSGDMPTGCGSQYMIGVGRSDHNDNFQGGYGATTINFAAPGVDVLTTSGGNNYTTVTGTSFSGPLTAGSIALLYSLPCPNLMAIAINDPQEAADIVFNALMDGNDERPAMTGYFVTNGRLNVKNSIDLLMEQTCSACSAPNLIETSAIEDHAVTISFSSNEEVDSYTIYYREQGFASWNSQTITDTSLTLTGLNNCTNYEYYIELLCAQEVSLPSATITFKTTGCGNCIDLDYCTTTVTNPGLKVSVLAPNNLATTYEEYAETSGWGTAIDDGYVFGDFVLVDDGSAAPAEGCETLVNAAELDGKIAVALRGTCNFSFKAINAQDAGAIGLIIVNNTGQMLNQLGAGDFSDDVQIPVIMIPQVDGAALLDALTNNETATGIMGVQNEWIDSFTFNGVTINSGDNSGYLAPESSPFEVDLNGTYDFSVMPAFGGTPIDEYTRIWIDYNQDGTFETSELVFDQGTANSEEVTGSITIPGTATLGSTRMRVQMNYQGVGSADLSEVCEDYISGEVEDFCITILSGEVCNYTITSTVQDPACNTVQDGSIELVVSGGTSLYTYAWSNNASNTPTLSNLGAGNYSVTITDDNGCDTTMSFQLDYSTSISIEEDVTQPSCEENNDGEIRVNATGANIFSYNWIGGPQSDTYSNLRAGSYTVIATADNNCQQQKSFLLSYTTNLSVTAEEINPTCDDSDDGSITAIGSGGTGITYSWVDGPQEATWSDLGNGSYIVTATAANGCFATDTFSIEANPVLAVASFSSTVTGLTIEGLNTSSNANEYLWDFGDQNTADGFNVEHTYAEAGTYLVCLTAIGDCNAETTCIEVIVNEDTSSLNETSQGVELLVYPNPASTSITVRVIGVNAKAIQLYDTTGKLILSELISSETTTVNVEKLLNGLYIYHIVDENNSELNTSKLTILK